MPFAPNKNAKELGIDITKKFRVVDDDLHFKKGDILTLVRDDISPSPEFTREIDGMNDYCLWSHLEYAEKTLETLEVGDWVVDDGGYYRRVLDVGKRNGELTVYELSRCGKDINHDDLKKRGGALTVFELKEYGYTHHTPEEKEEVTITISKKSLEALKESGIKIKE